MKQIELAEIIGLGRRNGNIGESLIGPQIAAHWLSRKKSGLEVLYDSCFTSVNIYCKGAFILERKRRRFRCVALFHICVFILQR